MKKRLDYLFIFMFLSFFSVVNVNAENYKCEYGTGLGDKWESKIVIHINVDKTNKKAGFTFVPGESPILQDINSSIKTEDWKQVDGGYTASKWFTNGSIHSGYALHTKIYNDTFLAKLMQLEDPNASDEEKRRHYCLNLIIGAYTNERNVSILTSTGEAKWGWNASVKKATSIALHTDQMSIDDTLDNDWKNTWFGTYEIKKQEKYYEKGAKDLDPKILNSSCTTFSLYLSSLQQAASSGGCDANAMFDKRYTEIIDLCNSYRQTAHYAEVNSTGETVAKNCSKACSLLYSQVDKMCGKTSNDASCGSLGHKLVSWLFKIIKFVRYAIPALLIILSILDYIKAMASDSEDEMKKVVSRFSKRLIAAALIFLIPFVLEFILNMFNLPGLNADNIFCAK